jgi:tetratricopeptide (TPR) repeat protein
VHHRGVLPDGRPYFAMKLINGQTLDNILKVGADRDQLLGVFEKVSQAVAYAHSHAIIHRDLTPRNLMVDKYGEVQVMDWGLAKDLKEHKVESDVKTPATPDETFYQSSQADTHTQAGSVIGTLRYMPPEQADGQPVDQRGDVFSLGAILVEILSGQPIYEGNDQADVLTKARKCELEGVFERLKKLGIDMTLINLARRCLAKDKTDRFADAGAVAREVAIYRAQVQERLRQKDNALVAEAARADGERKRREEEQGRLAAEKWAREEAEARADAEKKSRKEATARERAQRRGKRLAFAAAVVTALLAVAVVAFFWQRSRQDQTLREKAENLLSQGEEALAARPEVARERAVAVQALVGERSSFADVKRRAEQLSGNAGEMMRLHKEMETGVPALLRELDEAEYHILGSLWTLLPHEDPAGKRRIRRGDHTGSRLDIGIELSEKALRRFGLPDNSGILGELAKRGIDHPQAAQIEARASDAMFLLALAIERAQQGSGTDKLNAGRQRAVQLLDAAERLGNRTLSLYQARARFLLALSENDRAAQDNASAKSLDATSFFDHHLLAGEQHRSGKLATAATGYQKCLTLRPRDYWTLFRLAKVRDLQGHFEEGVGLYQSCISLRPKDPTAYNNRGELRHRLGKSKEAIVDFRRAIELEPEYFAAVQNLMLALAELKDIDEARKVRDAYRTGRKLSPSEEAELLDDLGIAYERAGNWDDSYKQYSAALDEDPDFVPALRNRANLAIRFRRFTDGEKDLKRAISLEPRNGELVYILGNLYDAAGRIVDAIGAYEQALRVDAKLTNAMYNKGALLRQVGRFKEAMAAQGRVIESKPGPEMMRQAIYERAMNLANLKDLRSALDDLNRVLVGDPVNVPALIARGQVRADLEKDLVGSEEDLSVAIHLARDEPDGYRARGITRSRQEKWQGVIEDYRQYLKLHPNAKDAEGIHTDISTALLHLGKLEEAEKEFENIKTIHSPSTLSNRGNLALKRGLLGKSIADFTEAIAKDENHTRAWALRGQAQMRKGRFVEASKDFDKALELEPGFYETLLFNGLAHYYRNDVAAARALLQIVAKERPDHVRGHMAKGILHMLDKEHAEAITELTPAVNDPILRPFALLLRARAWIEVGGPGLKLGLTDAVLVQRI